MASEHLLLQNNPRTDLRSLLHIAEAPRELWEEPVGAGKSNAPETGQAQGGIGQDIEEITVAPPKSCSAAEPSPVEIDVSRVVVESVGSADVLVVSRDALVKALEKVQGGVWSIEDAERALESEARKQLEQTYTGAFEQAYRDALEQLRQVGMWSDS